MELHMNVRTSRVRRYLAAFTVAALVGAGAVLGAAPATAAVPAEKAPFLQRDDSVVTADALPTVQIDSGYVWAQTTIGTTVYAAGSFSNARAALAAPGTNLTPRSNILAFDITTGGLLPFAPTVNGVIKSIAASPDGTRIYIGGTFNNVNGQTRWNFAALDAKTGALIAAVNPSVGGTGVYAIATAGSTVYVGGMFTQANGLARKNLAAFATSNGALLPWAPTTEQQVDAMVMEPGNEKVIAAGRFATMNGASQRGLAAIDPVSGGVITSWQAPNTVTNGLATGGNAGKAGIFALAADATGVYGTGWVFGDVNTGNLEGVFAAEAGSGAVRWVSDCHGDHYGVYSTGSTVYTTAHTHACETVNLWPEQNPRTYRYVEAYTAEARGTLTRSASAGGTYADWSGTPSPSAYAWYPDFTTGTASGLGQAGLSITGAGDFIAVAGEFGSVNNLRYQGIVRFSTKPNTGAKQGPRVDANAWGAPTAQSVTPGRVRVSIKGNWDRDDRDLTYELYRAGEANPVATTVASSGWWTQPTVAFTDTGLTPGSAQTYSVVVKDADGNKVTSQSASVTVADGEGSPYINAVLDDNATLYYPLGNNTQDWAGANTPLFGSSVTTVTPGAVAGPDSSASRFSGTSSSRVSSNSQVPGPGDFTTELWFKTNSNRGGKLIGFGSSRTGDSGSYDRHIYMQNNGRLTFGVYSGSTDVISTPTAYNDNQWHHVVATQSGTDGTKLYVDGALTASESTYVRAQDYQGYWRIAGDNLNSWPNSPSSSYFTGTIDEVAVYDTALTQSQVSNHFALGSGLIAPTAVFTPSVADLALSVDGTASTADAGRTITGYSWNWGDGSAPASAATATHSYAAPGTYAVTLTVTDSLGLVNSTTQNVVAAAPNVLPTAAFAATSNGLTTTVDAGASTDVDGSIASYAWNWGDGSPAGSGATATHLYGASGSYTVELTVTDDRGGTSAVTHVVTVTHAAPSAAFTSTTTGLALGVDAAASLASDGAALAFSWNWGDGSPAGTGAVASHEYAQEGAYNVTLTVTDSLGGTASTSASVTMTAVVYAAKDTFDRTLSNGWGSADAGGIWSALYGATSAASVSNGKGVLTLAPGGTRNMALAGTSLLDTHSTVQFSLDSTPASGNSYVGLAARQSTTKNYTVRVWMRAEGTVWLVAQQSGAVLLAAPVAGMSWAAGDVFNLATEVTGVSPTTIKAKIWKDGATEPGNWQLATTDSTAGLQQPGYVSTHLARTTASTTPVAATFDNFKVTDLGAPVVTNTPPTAVFTSASNDLVATVDGTASSDAEGAIASYSWNWGDSSALGTGATASHSYAAAGTYQVTLTVTDAGGLATAITHPVTVTAPGTANTPPVAAFTSSSADLALNVDGSASSDAEGAIASYSWNWGDAGAPGTGVTDAHTYAAAGTYDVTLTVTDAAGASASVTHSVTVTGPVASGFFAEDDFERAEAAGWGTSTTGGAWSVVYGPAAATSVSAGAGQIALPAGQTRNMMLNSVPVRDVDMSVNFTLDSAPVEGNSYAGLVARSGATDNYQVRAWLRSDGSTWLVAQRGSVVLGTYIVPGLIRAAGDTFTMRMSVVGADPTVVSAKIWRAGTAEPENWQLTVTDATPSVQVAGGVGVHANRTGPSTSPGGFQFDAFRVTQLG